MAAPENELVAAPPFNRNLPAVAYGSTGTMLVENTATDWGTGSDDHNGSVLARSVCELSPRMVSTEYR